MCFGCVVRFVDDFGVWGSGGMFNVVVKFFFKILEVYEVVYEVEDLYFGDFYLVFLFGVYFFFVILLLNIFYFECLQFGKC